jgi:GT2 family glycosyltransferase
MDDVLTSIGVEQWLRHPPVEQSRRGPADWIQGACMFVRMEAIQHVGPLDTRYFMYSEEVDWCRRFWMAGWEVWYLGDVSIVHIGSASSAKSDIRRRTALYRGRLGFRRRVDGPASSGILWLCIVVGLALRVAGRWFVQVASGRSIGRHDAGADWQLLKAVSRMDPRARWIAS